jgi:hypothetical protein
MVTGEVNKPDPTEAVKEALRLAVQTIDERFRTGAEAIILAREELKLRLDAMSAGINDKFAGNKELVDQLGKANAVALSAALETQKDLLKQLQVSFDTSIKVVNEKIDRLTSRIDTGEGRVVGVDLNSQTSREITRDYRRVETDNRAFYVALVAVAIAAAGLFFGLGLHK